MDGLGLKSDLSVFLLIHSFLLYLRNSIPIDNKPRELMMQVSHCVTDYFNSLPIDELGNWCQERLVGAPDKYEAQQGGFHVSGKILFMELSNPSISKKFFFNKWLPYILINMVFMHS